MIVSLQDAVATVSGGKAGALGELLRAGLPVPDGFVIPFDAFRLAVRGLDVMSAADGQSGLDHTRRAIETRLLPAGLLDAIAHGLGGLGDVPVAVRSSADNEDTVQASGAGQHESVLAVRGVAEVADAVRTCWGSLFSSRAIGYRNASGLRWSSDPAMAVLVQRLVDAEVSGVMFTPADRDGIVEIEGSWGLGPSVVGGTVTPDSYRVAADGAVARTISGKRTRLDRDGTRLVTRDVPAADRHRATLRDATAVRLARLGQQVAATLSGPQDIEWAIADSRIWVLQARPITAALPPPPGARVVSSGSLTGTPASHGTVTGTARIIKGPGDFARVCAGDILVCPYTDPAWTPLLHMASGIVTEIGGVLSHAAIVARELRIPAVLGIPRATTTLHDGSTIIVDGAAGTVTMTDI